ncbi:MAG TPA: hypothetical protein VF789_06630 [Thermoanaerobaculia bacterium]
MTAPLEGIDAATARLYRSVLESPVHGPFIRRISEIRQRSAPSNWRPDATLAIVPGAFYRENPRSGADGRLVREQAERLGCPTDLIPVDSSGAVRRNARIVRDWLLARADRPVILASLSKGGADVKMALAEPGAERAFRNVVAWVSLCGILNGTPNADWLLSWNPAAVLTRLYYRATGQRLDFLGDLRYGAGRPLDFELRLPAHVRLISVVGFPLREHLTQGIARSCHRRMTPLGPNDAGLILADVCALPGLIYPVWGADHYLQPKTDARPETDVRELVIAILQYLDETVPWRLPKSG